MAVGAGAFCLLFLSQYSVVLYAHICSCAVDTHNHHVLYCFATRTTYLFCFCTIECLMYHNFDFSCEMRTASAFFYLCYHLYIGG